VTASDEEVAAVLAVLSVLENERPVMLAAPASADQSAGLDSWVRASRLSGRRTGLARGPWRLSGRISRRSRA
jgi:hypothetical protein